MGGRINKGKAILFVLLTWAWALPWTIMPLLEIWGRFTPGKNILF
jgi:r-opsin